MTQRWEYLTLRVYEGEVIAINGQETGLGGKKRPKFPDYLNILGLEGWDVIFYGPENSSSTGAQTAEILLKRPVP